MKIVLASQSPRRKEILSMVFDTFEVRPTDTDENCDFDTPVCEIPQILAERKALASDMAEDELIIGSDTLVICNGEIMGKPKDREDAINMLEKLSGREHYVVSGICVRTKDKIYSDREETKLFMRPLERKEIEKYVDTDKPFDKAGGYGIQEMAGAFIERIEGDFYNVVGLPICRLTKILKDEFGISIV